MAPHPAQSKSAAAQARAGGEGRGGAGDCDDLLIHGQRWAGGEEGVVLDRQYNEAYLEDCTK